jgi:hypothetical protein
VGRLSHRRELGRSYSLTAHFRSSLIAHLSRDARDAPAAMRLQLNNDQSVVEAEPDVAAPPLAGPRVERFFASPIG